MVSSIPSHLSELAAHPALETGDTRDAALLLHQFNALSIGEGNVMAGGNTLAAMALTLANISPSGSCVVDPDDGTRVPVGMNVLASGGLSCSLIDDQVLAPLRDRQKGLIAHIGQRLERRKQKENSITETSVFLGKPREEPTLPTVLDRLEKDAHFNETDFEGDLRNLLCPPGHAHLSKITESPVMFAGIGSMDAMASASRFAHGGRLLAHLTLSEKSATGLLDKVCDELVSGCPTRGQLATSLKGEVICTDPTGALDSLVAAQSGHGWLERMLWLVDNAAGPGVEITGDAKHGPQLPKPGHCFRMALLEVAARRINFHRPEPMRLEWQVSRRQAEWNAFLARLEPRFPGIAGTLRPLWASLFFGLWQIFLAAPTGKAPHRFDLGQVDAFARLLAMRMVNARAVILDEHHNTLIEALAANFRIKLLEGPHTLRELMRRTNNLDAGTCLEVLERLADSGIVVIRNRNWQLATSPPSRARTLDV